VHALRRLNYQVTDESTNPLQKIDTDPCARALDNAADKRLTSRSDYIRVALLDRLRADGIDLCGAA